MPRYFTGQSVESRTLKLADARTFVALVKQVMDMPVPLSITYDEFWALETKRERDEAKRVSYVVAATFPESPWTEGRKLEHAGECNLLFLDIDELPDGTCPAAPFVADPSILRDRLGRYNFAAWTTASHRPEKPRLRVMVEADAIPVERYPDAVLTLAQKLGLSHVTRESVVAVQPMFRPTMFAGQDPDLDHPMLVTSLTGGSAFTEDDIAKDLDTLPGMVSGTRKDATRPRGTGDSVEDFLRFYQSPIPGITLEIAEEAIDVLSSDCSYAEWLDVAMALRHQFEDQEFEAYQLFDKWSATGAKYIGKADTAAKWKSITDQPKGRAPVTIRTLLKRANEHGWDGSKIKEESYQTVSKWMMFECSTYTQLIGEGVKRIAAAPLLNHAEEDSLLQTLMQASRERFGSKPTIQALRKDLKRHREFINQQKSKDIDVVTPKWGRGLVYVVADNRFFRQATRQFYGIQEFDNVYSRELLPTAEDLMKADKEVNQATLNTPIFLPSKFVLNHLKCPTVDDYDYDPSEPEEIVYERDRRIFVNTYRRSYKTADRDQAAQAEDTLLDHLCNLIAEPEYRRVVLDWMAFNVQHPGLKIRWALFLQGAEGCGKTILAQVMRAVLGNDNARIINNSTIKKGWTEWAVGSQFIAIEEIRVAGTNRHDLMNILKEPISNDYIAVNERNKATVTRRNVTNYMVFSNYHDALAVTEESRRYFVLKSTLQKKAQVEELTRRNPDYFANLVYMFECLQGGLRHYLENRTISDAFNSNGQAPVTKYLHEMVEDTSNELMSFLRMIWEDGDNPLVRQDILCAGPLVTQLQMEGMQHVNPQYLSTVLHDAGFSRLEGRPVIAGARQQVWVRKDLLKTDKPLDVLRQRATLGEEEWV